MRQRREIPIHIFELAFATVSYEPCVDRHHASTFVAAAAIILRGGRRHHASTFVVAVTSHNCYNTIE